MKLHPILLIVSALLVITASAGAQENDNATAWGGRGILLRMTEQGATLQFECAHGAIQQTIQPDAAGNFSVPGTYTPERGGPIQKDNASPDLPATYKGSISGDTMHLEVIPSDKRLQPPPFTLTKGRMVKIVRCR